MKNIGEWVRSHNWLHRALRTFVQTALGVLAGAIVEASGMVGDMDIQAVVVMAVATGLAAVMNLSAAKEERRRRLMTEVSRAEFEQLRHEVERHSKAIARQETQYAVISTKLTAILWLLGAVGTAVIAAVVRMALGGVL